MAALRLLMASDSRLAVSCEDHLARRFLGPAYRLIAAACPASLLRDAVERKAPGSYCFSIARTRHFDEVLLAEARAGIDQLVLLGAGYDSRTVRFQKELASLRVFEVDHPATQSRKLRILRRALPHPPSNVTFVPVDFNRQSLGQTLRAHGFRRCATTLFLWEGVSYYLPPTAVDRILGFVAGCGAESSVVFDYALRRFVEGDTSTYGGGQVARWLSRIGEPFLFGLDPSEADALLGRHGLRLISDLGPEDLEAAYLRKRDGQRLGRCLGHLRIAHARRAAGPAENGNEDSGP